MKYVLPLAILATLLASLATSYGMMRLSQDYRSNMATGLKWRADVIGRLDSLGADKTTPAAN